MKTTIFIIIYILFFTSCFGFKYFPSKGISAIYIVIIVYGIITGFRYKFVFRKQLLLFLIFIICNIISCYFIREQSIIGTLAVETNIMAILLTFLLVKYKMNIHRIEIALSFLSVFFCIVYAIQNFMYPISIYTEINTDLIKVTEETSARLRFTGQGIGSLGYFMFINKYFETRNKKNILLALICFSFLILMAFRTMIVAALIGTLYLYSKYYTISLKNILKITLSLTSIFIISYVILPQFHDKIFFLFDRFTEISELDRSYIRFITLDYYYNNFFINPLEYIFGAGFPNFKESGKYAFQIQENINSGIFWDDWGLLGLSWILGPIPVILLVIISIKAIKLKVDRKYKYFAAWYIFLLLISCLNTEFFRTGNPSIHALVLYCLILANRIYENRNRYVS